MLVTTPPRMRAAADHVGASLEAGLLQGRHQGRWLWLVAQALGSLDRGWSTTGQVFHDLVCLALPLVATGKIGRAHV